MQKYFQNKTGVYSRNNLSKINDRAYVANLDDYKSIEIHWIALGVIAENLTYFDGFGAGDILKEITKFKINKNIMANIYRIQVYHSIMCGYFCFEFIDLMSK